MLRTIGYIGAFVTCPCHAALMLLLLGGTASGAWLSANLWVTIAAFTVAFVFFLWLALRGGTTESFGQTRSA